MENKFLIILLLLLSFILLFNACGKKPEDPLGINLDDFPAPPIDVKITVGDRVIGLSWKHPDVSRIAKYKIYRQDTTSQNFRVIASTENLSYIDTNLQNNQIYRYQITAVAKNGLEGKPSEIVFAKPSIFGIIINSGQIFTNSRVVNLSLTAPSTTTLVMISNDSLFTNAQWETFTATKSWLLLPGDGKKTVFAKFRDALDRETITAYSDDIVLDTEAVIKQVLHNAGNRILTPADTVHFAVITDEPGGKAWVDINNVRLGLALFDDGSNGDRIANDGSYEVDYVVPTGPEVENTLVVGNFIDRAGNVADKFNAPERLTIRRPPTPVKLIAVAPTIGSSRALNLFWSQNTDPDFANYRIYRALTPGVDTRSTLVTIIQNQTTVTFTDTTLAPNTRYFYRVFVFDVTGLFFGSNELSGKTNP